MTVVMRSVTIPAGAVALQGDLAVPAATVGIVVFAHGTGSSRFSPRNAYVARILQDAGLATLLLDLLTEEEARVRTNVFDVPMLADRLRAAVRWVRAQPEVHGVHIGYFGASTGAAAALWAAAIREDEIAAVVSRGGRPDLAVERLRLVRAPTLLIVGGRDEKVLELNRKAHGAITCECRLEIVPDATHLFEEPGALEEVARLASTWFARNLSAGVVGADRPERGRTISPST